VVVSAHAHLAAGGFNGAVLYSAFKMKKKPERE
jgi:hypothetical protein